MKSTRSGEEPNARPFQGNIDLSGVIPAIEPPEAVSDALARSVEDEANLYETLLCHRLGMAYRLAERNLALVGDIDAALAGIAAQTPGPLILFPPSATHGALGVALDQREVVEVARGLGRDGMISLEMASDLPCGGVAIIASPTDPLGNVLSANDAVRLARSCDWVVIDERYAEYAGQSLLKVASEFPNVIVMRSFRARLGARDADAGWALGSPRAKDLLAAVSSPLPPAVGRAAAAAYSAKTDSRVHISLVRHERSRLYRTLRKLSYLQPLPSWAPFVAARVEVGDRETLVALLCARGIRVHVPEEPGLERYIRIGIGTRSAMEFLRRTLLAIAPEMLGAQLASRGGYPYRFALRSEEFGQPEVRQIEERGQRSA